MNNVLAKYDRKVTLIAFGEAAREFVSGSKFAGKNSLFSVHDIKTDVQDLARKEADYRKFGAKAILDCQDTCKETDIMFSLVPANQTEHATKALASEHMNSALYFDYKSCAAKTKRRPAKLIEAAGGRYADLATLTSAHPKLRQSPCFIAGPHTAAVQAVMTDLCMGAQSAGPQQ
mgnify:FL=1